MVAATVLTAIGVILVGLFTGKYFLIFIGLALFAIPFLATLNLTGAWWIVLVIVLVIIIKIVGSKK